MDRTENDPISGLKYPSVEIPKFNSRVSLILHSTAPLDTNSLSPEKLAALNAAATIAGEAGRTCYSGTLQTPLDYLTRSSKYREVTDNITRTTRESGHLSTREHVHYTFAIEGISRNAIYFLHSHPYYVSDMMSQRYVNLAETKPLIPDLGNSELNQKAFEAAANLVSGYNQLYRALTPTTKELLLERFQGRNNPVWEKQINDEAGKKAQEVARYLLPLGTPSSLYHTISEVTLLRLYHLSQTIPGQPEVQNIIEGMVAVVSQTDPSFKQELTVPIEPFPNNPTPAFTDFSEEFDSLIDGFPIKLDPTQELPSQKLAQAVRNTLWKSSRELSDAEALDLLLNPAQNKLLSETSGDIVIDRLGQCLNQVSFSALVSLSHVANEQFHRHRGFDHTEQTLLSIPQSDRDIIVPTILEKNPEALNLYLTLQKQHNQTLTELHEAGVPLESLQYLLTNATRIRKSINAPFGALYHFIKLRTCLTAQEEIYHLTLSLVKQIKDIDPVLGKYLESPSPCGIRRQANKTPYCSEGPRFCGIRVWDFKLDDFPKRYI